MDIAWQTVDGALDRIRKEVRLQREKSNSLCKQRTAHDWQQTRADMRRDPGLSEESISYFWKAHTVTVLVFLIACLVYGATRPESEDAGDGRFKRLYWGLPQTSPKSCLEF